MILALKRVIEKFGRPLALYTDRHGIFEAHKKGQPDYEGETQFSRALAELDIELIKAHSPQAKGRVERSFGTAQDRWVKEMRRMCLTSGLGITSHPVFTSNILFSPLDFGLSHAYYSSARD